MPTPGKKTQDRAYFSYSAEDGTVSATVVAYLNGKLTKSFSSREGKRRGVDALLAYWKPYALKAQKANARNIRSAAEQSVEMLFRQIQNICDEFGVNLPVTPTPFNLDALVKAVVDQIERPLPQAPAMSSAPLSEPTRQPFDEVIFVDDDALLGDLE